MIETVYRIDIKLKDVTFDKTRNTTMVNEKRTLISSVYDQVG